jgi:hypothetical protein
MPLSFPFEKVSSPIFGTVFRPVAWVSFWSKTKNEWIGIWMIVDSGADYTLLPRYMSEYLGINLKNDCKSFSTFGVGGQEAVFLYKKTKIKLGIWELTAPIGFLDNDSIPPLLGRQGFMEKFATLFSNHKTIFSDQLPKL